MGFWSDLAQLPRRVREIDESLQLMEINMSDLQDAVAKLPEAVAGASGRLQQQVDDLKAALDAVNSDLSAERALADELAASENAEDVAQNAEIQGLRDSLDSSISDATNAVGVIENSVADLNKLGKPAEEVPEEPVDEPVSE